MRGKIIASVSAAVALLLVFYLWRDLNIPLSADLEKLPDIVVEDLTFDRKIDGNDWNIKATRVEHRNGVITAEDLDMRVKGSSDGRISHVEARSGDFSRESGDFSLSLVEGTAFFDERSVNWNAPLAHYDSSGDVWTLEKGIVASDDQIFLSGEIATISAGNVFRIEKGANARWNVKE